MIKHFLFILVYLLFVSLTSHAHVRNVFPKNDEIILVKTSIAIATIIQFPDSTSVQMPIIGDQSGFRIETLDKGITIKPLRQNAKTNLYLFTDKKRYNFRLVTAAQDEADYILYIKSATQSLDAKWREIHKASSNSNLSLSVARISSSKDQTIILDCILKSKTSFSVSAENFWIFQARESKVINSIFLPDKTVSKHSPFMFAIAISKNDLKEGKTIEVAFRNKLNSLSVEISKEVLWK